MVHASDLIAIDIEKYLAQHANKQLLRFITCGSVDDGKSTLIDRLIYESKMIFENKFAALESDSQRWGTQSNEFDSSLLIDGRAAGHEQDISIDVAYRFFSTDRRKFIVAEAPGHEQYTRNMIAGASTADAAVVVLDACKGVLTQARQHSYLVSLIGIRRVVVAVNKMDLVNYCEATFHRIVACYLDFARKIGMENITFIPMSAFKGDNITILSDHMPWYNGTTLMTCLDSLEIDKDRMLHTPFRLPVQWINRPNLDFRGFAGTITGGMVKVGDRIRVQPTGKESCVARIVTHGGDIDQAIVGQSITLTLTDEIDISRGDIISTANSPAGIADQFEVTIVWMHDDPLLAGRPYLLKVGAQTTNATITDIKYQVNVDTLEHIAAKTLTLNAIGVCNISLDRQIAFDSYADNRDTGGFILIDRMSNSTIGAGLLHFALRRAHNIHIQHIDVNKAARARIKGQKSCVLWLTGLSGAGKSTIANLVEKQLHAMGRHTYLLDGDNVRHGLNKDLGFTDADRVENIRRIAEVAKLMVDAGLIVITAFISPFRSERKMARSLLNEGEFLEIFIDTPLAVAEERDVKGLYKKARKGELKNFTGIDSPYEAPELPELWINAALEQPAEAAERIVNTVRELNILED